MCILLETLQGRQFMAQCDLKQVPGMLIYAYRYTVYNHNYLKTLDMTTMETTLYFV